MAWRRDRDAFLIAKGCCTGAAPPADRAVASPCSKRGAGFEDGGPWVGGAFAWFRPALRRRRCGAVDRPASSRRRAVALALHARRTGRPHAAAGAAAWPSPLGSLAAGIASGIAPVTFSTALHELLQPRAAQEDLVLAAVEHAGEQRLLEGQQRRACPPRSSPGR